MSEEQREAGRASSQANDGRLLGASFEAHNSQSFGEDVGESFASSNAEEAREAVKTVRGRRSRWWVIAAVILAVALTVFLVHQFTGGNSKTAGGKSGAAGAQPGGAGGGRGQNGPAAITTGQTQTGDMPVYVEALGTVTPLNTVSVYSQVTGRVMSVNYREGQTVQKGQVLIEVDPRPYQATLAQAQGTLLHDQGVLAQAKIDLARYQAAFARNAIAKQMLDDQEQAVLQDQGTVATDQASINYDEVQLSYCHIVAPITGRVGLRLVDPGNTIFSGSGSTLVVITQNNPMTVVFNVSEDQLPEVQAQLRGRGATLPVDIYDRADAKQLGAGRLTSLDNEVDTTTGTVKFRATLDNRAGTFYPNQFVNARLLVKTLRGATLVPTASVEHNGTQAFLYVVKPGAKGGDVVVVQNVTAATNNDTATAVTGINPGVTVATSGFDRLENGVPVHIANGRGAAPDKSTAPSTGGPGAKPSANTASSPPTTGNDNASSPGSGAGASAGGTGSRNASKAP